jgi:hypothetical protein
VAKSALFERVKHQTWPLLSQTPAEMPLHWAMARLKSHAHQHVGFSAPIFLLLQRPVYGFSELRVGLFDRAPGAITGALSKNASLEAFCVTPFQASRE